MDLAEIVGAIQVVDLPVKTRQAAIRTLVRAAKWDAEGISPDDVIEAVEERERAAQTIVADGFAMPHGRINWDGDYRVVLGRSRAGVDYGAPGGERVHLIVLWVVGRRRETHLEVLAALADLLKSDEFRQSLVDAPDVRGIEKLLHSRIGPQPDGALKRSPSVSQLGHLLVEQAIRIAVSLPAQALLLAVESPEMIPWDRLESYSGRLLIVSSEGTEEVEAHHPHAHVFEVPHTSLSRMDRAHLGVLLAASEGLLSESIWVVCVTGPQSAQLDSITVIRPDPHLQAMFSGKGKHEAASIRSAVVMRVLSLAIELASEGREGKAVGAMFVIGDIPRVLRHARQLVFNPFHGYSRQLRNVLDPSLAETIKEFALVDGAFLVQGDGTVQSAGTYLVPKLIPEGLPHGLGTRHQTAAGITAHTTAIAITISQSTGTVSVFRHGGIVFTLERGTFTRW